MPNNFRLITLISLLILGGGVILFFMVELWQSRKRAPFIPSSRASLKTILDRIPLPPSGLIIDLGAGDGRFLREVKKRYPHAQVRGYEISLLALVVNWLRNLYSSTPVTVVYEDFFQADLSQADVLFCFLLPMDLKSLEHKLQTELKPGALVISNTFSFPHWKPERTISSAETGLAGHIRVYRQEKIEL